MVKRLPSFKNRFLIVFISLGPLVFCDPRSWAANGDGVGGSISVTAVAPIYRILLYLRN
jgi:hypothetical protein